MSVLSKITAWTDGSTHKTAGVASAILLSGDYYLASINKSYSVRDSHETELYGILQVLEYVNETGVEVEEIEIYTDAESITNIYSGYLKDPSSIRKDKYSAIWRKIVKLSKGVKLTIKYEPGHSTEHNPNKVCDVTGRIIRRSGIDILKKGK